MTRLKKFEEETKDLLENLRAALSENTAALLCVKNRLTVTQMNALFDNEIPETPSGPTLKMEDEERLWEVKAALDATTALNESLQEEMDELKEAYNKLYKEAMAREEELEEEVSRLQTEGAIRPSLLGPLRSVVYIDSDNKDVKDPTVNDLIQGTVTLAKEALLQVEKDAIQLKRYSSRIEQLENLIARDFG
jgi:FtsZ-binding cell division protein ZapB